MQLEHAICGVTSSPDTKELDAALAAAREKFLAVKKSAENKFAGFRYPTYTDMANATFKALHGAGLVMKFSSGFVAHAAYTGEVMVGRLVHHKSGQWESSVVPKRYPTKKNGEIQDDGQGLEIADAYAKKALIMQLTGAWLEGEEPEVQQDQARKVAQEIVEGDAPAPKPASKKPVSTDLFKRVENRMKMVRTVPHELERCMADAEKLVESGDLTEEQLIRLQRQFGALMPKKEVAHAVDG